MKVRIWQNYFAFPGVSVVLIWCIMIYLELAPAATKGVIQRARWFLLLGWLGVQLFQQRTAVLNVLHKPLHFLKFPHFYYLAYAFLALASASYESEPVSIRTAIYLLLFVLIIILVTFHIANQPIAQRIISVKRLWDLIIFIFVIRLLLLFIGMVIFADRSVVTVAVGPITLLRISHLSFYGYLNANTAGYAGALLLVAAINRWWQGSSARTYWGIVGVVGLLALLLGYSRTMFITLGVVAMVYLFVQRKWLWLLALMVAGGLLFSQVKLATAFLLRGQDTTSVLNLGNRLYIWKAAWHAFQESPLVGHGYLAGEERALQTALEQLYPDKQPYAASHNAFLSALVSTGVLGFSLLLTAFLLTGWRLVSHFNLARNLYGPYRLVAYELLAVLLIFVLSSLFFNGMLYVSLGIRNLPLLSFFVFAGATFVEREEK